MKSLRLKMKDDNPLEVSHFYLLIYDGYLLKVDDVNLQKKKNCRLSGQKNLCTLLEIAICYCTTFGRDAMVLQHPEGVISSQGAKPRGMK